MNHTLIFRIIVFVGLTGLIVSLFFYCVKDNNPVLGAIIFFGVITIISSNIKLFKIFFLAFLSPLFLCAQNTPQSESKKILVVSDKPFFIPIDSLKNTGVQSFENLSFVVDSLKTKTIFSDGIEKKHTYIFLRILNGSIRLSKNDTIEKRNLSLVLFESNNNPKPKHLNGQIWYFKPD